MRVAKQLNFLRLAYVIRLFGSKTGHLCTTVLMFEPLLTLLSEQIERRRTIEWPARSLDLTLCGFSMWGRLKKKVFSKKPRSLEHLEELIAGHFDVLFTQQ